MVMTLSMSLFLLWSMHDLSNCFLSYFIQLYDYYALLNCLHKVLMVIISNSSVPLGVTFTLLLYIPANSSTWFGLEESSWLDCKLFFNLQQDHHQVIILNYLNTIQISRLLIIGLFEQSDVWGKIDFGWVSLRLLQSINISTKRKGQLY